MVHEYLSTIKTELGFLYEMLVKEILLKYDETSVTASLNICVVSRADWANWVPLIAKGHQT